MQVAKMKNISSGFFLVLALVVLANAHSETHTPPRVHSVLPHKSNAQIEPESSVLQSSGDWVTVTWTADKHIYNTTIGVYSPSNTDFKKRAPVKWMSIPPGSDSGSANFQLTNLRSDYAFVLIEDGSIVAVSSPVTFANPNEPLQIHLALTPTPSTLSVMWNTLNATAPTVRWGNQSGMYQWNASAESHTYTALDLCGEPANKYAWIEPGLFHEAYMTDLEPNVVYYYIVGDEEYGWSEEISFIGPRSMENSSTVSFLAYGDMGKLEADSSNEHWAMPGSLATSISLTNAVNEHSYDAILHIGDISYAVGYAPQWDVFFRMIEPFASKVPYLVCPGNHEYDYLTFTWLNGSDSGGECGIPYRNRFHMPIAGNPTDSAYYSNRTGNWYSFNMGPVHVLVMDTEELFNDITQGQLLFIAQDLASVNRQETPFVIFAGHRPMYVDSDDTTYNDPRTYQGMARLLQEYVEPLLYKFQVDLALWGHVHAYQRTCPLFNGTCVSDGIPHAIIGMAGAGFATDVAYPPPSYMMYYDYSNFGYANITATPEVLQLQFITNNGAVNDEIILNSKF